MASILVVDDELGIRGLLSDILSDEGHTVELAENAAQARQARLNRRPDLVLLDIWMPDVDGITLLKEWGSTGQLTMPVIMMSGHGTIDTAVEATRYGACAFLEKPITLQKLLKAVEQSLVRPGATAPATAAPHTAPAAHGGLTATPLRRDDTRPALASAPTGLGARSLAPGTATPLAGLSGLTAPITPMPPVDAEPADTGGAHQRFDLDRPLREARDAFEKSYFEFHLAKEHGSMTRVAEKTGLERTHLYRKLKQLGVDLSRGKLRGSV
ncbi:MAG: hypothetical protein RLY78_2061 [Pseudomonadota bacterium]|jgi:DNA-binding NtrC family response regulator|uniref:Response regulator n=1 Tax=Pseudaquabacterium rugosum TaxID=2984194 RepID=A0ABU9BGM2_9BURK|nr:hypothetical protein [Pseudomonadota bacterium]